MAQSIIPPKPDHVKWTDDQWKAIYAKNQDILVAAAAGSGKTAVLVERMIQRILSEEDPINVDELLVVTFTNASAAEMRHRIGEALEKAIEDDPKSINLKKQLTLLNRASISTLHSFCLEVIRKYYYLLDIDPGFRIADTTEAQLLRDEVMDELFEDEYSTEDNETFFSLVDTFTNDRSDEGLQDIIRNVYDFAMANASPGNYLKSMVNMYDVQEDVTIEELAFMQYLLYDIELQLEGAKQLFQQALELTKLPGGPAPRATNLLSDIQLIDGLISAKQDSWKLLYQAIQKVPFSRANPCKGDDYDPLLIEKAQKLRDKAKKMVTDLGNELFSRKPESYIRDMQELKGHIETIVRLVFSFAERFAEMKKQKSLVDFADLEHFCLRILTDELYQNGTRTPSEAALSYRNRFKEVLVDEYQDTNMVQEAILQLVKKESEESGNLFMVGDVKQSIYRFRLAEPNLFLGKYQRFSVDGNVRGHRIDLSQNFRSRMEVLDGTNYLFKQLMGEKVGEINYDEAAELKLGATYPPDDNPIELLLIDQGNSADKTDSSNLTEGEEDTAFDRNDLEQSQLEARLMAQKIKEMISERKPVYNPKTKSTEPLKYRDIVILLRSMPWAPQIIEEFKQHGIPVYANLATGYFEATEVAVMIALLKVIDNPFQDIPLAAVLRSPIVGLKENELARIRIQQKNGTFYEALASLCKQKPSTQMEEVYEKVRPFYDRLQEWRTMARQGSLSQLIWHLLRETHFYEFVGGMPGGKQRQANLRALHDRARGYESTTFRGLFRFLRFIERMRERGDDLGAARALGEQEDVVRIMTIHSSKGLEFPVVFIAGLGRQFNTLDLKKPFMLDKEFGFATKYVNAEKRISYPSLPQIAFKRKKKMEMLSEEMRVLYVALTRAKEKLFLLASVKDVQKASEKWNRSQSNPNWLLPEYDRASATSFLDWVAPALVRHRHGSLLNPTGDPLGGILPIDLTEHPSYWKIDIYTPEQVAAFEIVSNQENQDEMDHVLKGIPISISTNTVDIVNKQLSWNYDYKEASLHRSKQSVSELKRQQELFSEGSGSELKKTFSKPLFKRPRFMQEKALTPAERGTALHMVMQHVDFNQELTEASINSLMEQMVINELLTKEQREAINPSVIASFFLTKLGKRLIGAHTIKREIPFSASLKASEVYADWKGEEEPVLVQGIIDCLFEDNQGTVLLDYKTDAITERFKGGFEEAKSVLEDRYRVQIHLYAKAVEQILKNPIDEKILFFFDGGHIITIK
jgi:ATP-dependent helicase/nuclease subunit A